MAANMKKWKNIYRKGWLFHTNDVYLSTILVFCHCQVFKTNLMHIRMKRCKIYILTYLIRIGDVVPVPSWSSCNVAAVGFITPAIGRCLLRFARINRTQKMERTSQISLLAFLRPFNFFQENCLPGRGCFFPAFSSFSLVFMLKNNSPTIFHCPGVSMDATGRQTNSWPMIRT